MPLNLVPQPTQRVSATQAPILQNFTLLQAWSIVNHTDVSAALPGWHTNLTFPAALATSSPALSASTQLALLPFNVSGVIQLATQRFGATPVPFTDGTASQQGYARFGNGIIVKWGVASTTANSTSTTGALAQGPAYAAGNIYIALFNPLHAASGVAETAWAIGFGTNQVDFQYYTIAAGGVLARPGSVQVQYLIIGVE